MLTALKKTGINVEELIKALGSHVSEQRSA